ncbi:MAG: GNAT family N-acetyltransferase [Gemmatimonadaceae bacterium]
MRNNTPAITIRPCCLEDTPRVVALFRASVMSIARRDYTEAQLRAWAPDDIDSETCARRRTAKSTWIAEIGAHIAGFSDLEADGHIDMQYVHPAFQRRGVARALLAYIEDVARGRGVGRLYTEASITARPVFENMGFRVLGPQMVTVRGESMKNYRMEKQLVPSAKSGMPP